jgi:hypothetical protein
MSSTLGHCVLPSLHRACGLTSEYCRSFVNASMSLFRVSGGRPRFLSSSGCGRRLDEAIDALPRHLLSTSTWPCYPLVPNRLRVTMSTVEAKGTVGEGRVIAPARFHRSSRPPEIWTSSVCNQRRY